MEEDLAGATLVKAVGVMRLVDRQGHQMMFTSMDEETAEHRSSLVISFEEWVDLDRPFEITVTIEPGDRLGE